MVNYMNQVNFAGIDEIVNNNRVRATAVQGTNAQGTMWMAGTGVATNFTAGQTGITITAAILGGGIVVQTPNTTVTWTLDTATNILAYMNANSAGVNVGDILVCDVINASTTAANTITISFGTGGGFDTGQTSLVMGGGTSRTLMIKITNTSTPAYIVYG